MLERWNPENSLETRESGQAFNKSPQKLLLLVVFFSLSPQATERTSIWLWPLRKHVPISMHSVGRRIIGMGKGKWVKASEEDPISRQRHQSMAKQAGGKFLVAKLRARGEKKCLDKARDAAVGDKYKWNKSKAAVPPQPADAAAWVTKGTFYGSCCVSFGVQ